LKERLESLATRKDDLLTISEIGIDQIIVDEAQEFRKLSFATNMSTLKGVDPNGSQRAWDLFVKSRFVETKNPGRALVLASGTPITNTLGEMFSVQRYLGYAALFERGLHEFDAWASTFGDVTTELELQPSGKYKPVTRFATFVNVPELIAMFRSFADVVMPEDLRRYVRSRRSRPASARSSPRSRRMPSSAIRPCSASASRRSRSATARRSPVTTSCFPSSLMGGTLRSICVWSIRTTTTKPPIS
jgi:N12 class adenine-specific DNA methylase